MDSKLYVTARYEAVSLKDKEIATSLTVFVSRNDQTDD